MHFFYIDESGDTGRNLRDAQQPIMVLGGVSIADKKWNNTQVAFHRVISDYFENNIPENFELHSHQLLSPNGEGPFYRHSMESRTKLALDLLTLLEDNGHDVHQIAFDKEEIHNTDCGVNLCFNPSRPYELGFDYLITYINWYVRNKLGQSARGLIILDEKRDQHDNIQRILTNRRFETTQAHRIKWIVEFGYPIDSEKNPMIQLSDLVVYCTRKFLEIENGHCTNWRQEAKKFYGKCYNLINDRIANKGLKQRGERSRDIRRLNEYINEVRATHRTQWKRHYKLE